MKALKDPWSQYTAKYTIYTCPIKFKNHMLYIYGFEIFMYTLSYGKETIKTLFTLNIGDQNATYVFAFKDTHSMYLNLNLQ